LPIQICNPIWNARKIGGMGVFLIRKMTDGLAYRREEKQQYLTMTILNR